MLSSLSFDSVQTWDLEHPVHKKPKSHQDTDRAMDIIELNEAVRVAKAKMKAMENEKRDDGDSLR